MKQEKLTWHDTGIEMRGPSSAADAALVDGVLGLPIYPQEMNRSYVSDYDVLYIPSPDGNPAHQRGIYFLSHTIDGKSRRAAFYEIAPGAHSLLLTDPPPEMRGNSTVDGHAVQVRMFPVEVQRPGHGPEYTIQALAVVERDDKSAWTLRLLWPGPAIFWPRSLP